MNAQVLVSILIPAYKPTWFELALESALTQDYIHCEIIIGDDSNASQIHEIVERYRKISKFSIKYYKNSPALGEIPNLSHLISKANGAYLKFLYDDDLLVPHAISQLVSALEQTPAAVIATSKRERIDTTNKKLPDQIYTVAPVLENSVFHGQDIITWQADNIINFIGEPSSVLVRTKTMIEILNEKKLLHTLIDEEFPYIADLVIYLRLLRKGHLVYLVDVLSKFRVSIEQISQEARLDNLTALRSHERLPVEIKELGWYDCDKNKNLVRVASLNSPDSFNSIDLNLALQNALTESHFKKWFSQRSLMDVEQKIIANYLEDKSINRLAIIIDARDACCTDLQITLKSLDVSISGLTIQPVIFSNLSERFNPSKFASLNVNVLTRELIPTLNEYIFENDFDWLIILSAGSEFYSSGLNALGTALHEVEHCQLIYADEVYPVDGRMVGASFRPDFNLDLLLSNPSTMSTHWIFRREYIKKIGGFSLIWPETYELDVILRTIENQPFDVIGHLAEPLVQARNQPRINDEERLRILKHLHYRGYPEAEIDISPHNTFKIKYNHVKSSSVSIIVLIANDFPNLVACITSLMEKTSSKNYEILLVCSEGGSRSQTDWLIGMSKIDPERIKVLQIKGGYHRSKMINSAASSARGDYLLVIKSDLAILDGNWIDNLLNHANRPEVAVVGGKQIYKNGQINHAGYILGVNGSVGEAFYGENHENYGHMGRLQCDQNYSVVSGDFMMIRTELFRAANGLDESLLHFDDVDFCLRLREDGFMTVWTPYVCMLRQVNHEQRNDNSLLNDEENQIVEKWHNYFINDPCYNQNLTLNNVNFDVSSDSELTWRPLSWRPLPVVMPFMADFFGCGYYRIIKPYEAMRENGLIDGKLSSVLINSTEMNRYNPDSLIFQRRIDTDFHEWIKKISKHSRAFKVYELDDYLPNIPLKNHHRSEFGSDVKKMMRRSLSYMDRFVVSTEPLAEAFAGMHRDIVVRKNRLSLDWWSNLQSLRGQGKKPRIGWAGGSSHTGDLEMIVDVVRHFANDVEWVFFGMCPSKLRPYIHEFHHGVEIERYPSKLASLNLDLALAPVEDNFFNACKSNLRLMEYGACGIPVVCSDVECYRGDLTVTRVKNRYKDWVDAINMHLSDPDASGRMGAILKSEIHRYWMLEEEHLIAWTGAWTANSRLNFKKLSDS